MYITVLCKVVDNFGDIGVAWRLCRRLAKIQSKYKICLIVDDLESFSKIEDRLPRRLASEAKQSIIIVFTSFEKKTQCQFNFLCGHFEDFESFS